MSGSKQVIDVSLVCIMYPWALVHFKFNLKIDVLSRLECRSQGETMVEFCRHSNIKIIGIRLWWHRNFSREMIFVGAGGPLLDFL